MSKLGYFLVGMLAGAATLGAAAWAVTEYAGSDGASRLASLDDGQHRLRLRPGRIRARRI